MAQVRATAARCVDAVIRHRKSLSEVLPPATDRVKDRDKGLLKALVYQTLRHGFSLKRDVEAALSKPLRGKDHDIVALLMVGLCQIRFLNVADHAAVNATVDATRILKKPWTRGLVNAVLRRFLRGELTTDGSDPEVSWEHPLWLIEAIQRGWPDDWETVLENAQHQGPMTLRVNRRVFQRNDYRALLADLGIESEPTAYSPDGLVLHAATEVTALPHFAEGACSVQDESGQMAVHWLDPKPGESILDACAAPGSKTGHILERLNGSGEVVAVDSQAHRLERLADTLGRIGASAELHVTDAQQLAEQFPERRFDRILLDVPCTGTGVVRRHPDIKWLRQPEDVSRLGEIQRHILDAAWQVLKPGGMLMYSTCSVLPAENSEQVTAFLQTTPDASVVALPVAGSQARAAAVGVQWLPEINGADGFYFALLHKAG